ncbi:cohesin domain-containing protein [Faecalimonas sp.]
MKIMKKIAAFMLAFCLTVPMYSVMSYAASGIVSFTDLQTKTGETVEVACALRAGSGSLETFNATLKYDPSLLSFKEGNGVTKESDGVLKFSGKGDGSNKIRFTMKFQALKVGTAKIEVTDSTGTVTGGEKVECENGTSTIQIAEGTTPPAEPEQPAGDNKEETNQNGITIGDKSYKFSEEFAPTSIPVGFVETKLPYDGGERKFVRQENGSITLGYLVDAEGKGDFFLYNEDDATFSPYVQVTVSPSTSIVLLEKSKEVKVPEGYRKVKLTVNNHEFPAWQDKKHEGFYLVYAMDSHGEKGFYQYDANQGSYQKYITQQIGAVNQDSSKVSKLNNFIIGNLSMIILCTGLGILLLIIIIIVLSVKLRHRNLELDDLYEEYDIDEKELSNEEDEEEASFIEENELEDTIVEEDDQEENDFFEDDFEERFTKEDDFDSEDLDEDDFEEEFDDLDDFEDFDFDDDDEDDFDINFVDLD